LRIKLILLPSPTCPLVSQFAANAVQLCAQAPGSAAKPEITTQPEGVYYNLEGERVEEGDK